MKVEDALDDVLRDCRRRLETITLSVPELETAGLPPPPPPAYFPPLPERVRTPPPAPKPVPVPASAVPAAPPAAPPAPVPPAARDFPVFQDEPEEPEYFPPTPRPARTPAPAPAPAPAQAAPAVAKKAPFPVATAVKAAAALAAAGVLAALGLWAGHRAGGEPRFEINDARAFAFKPAARRLLVVRPPDLLEYDAEGLIVGRTDWNRRAAAVSWNDGSLWSVDGETAEAVETREGERPTTFNLNHVPAAIFAKDNTIWTVEKGGKAVHQYLVSRSILGAMLQPLDLMELPDLVPESIAVDAEGELWALDAETRAVYRYAAEKGVYRRVASAPLSPVLGPSSSLRGMALDGDGVWILTGPSSPDGAALMRRVRVDGLQWTKG